MGRADDANLHLYTCVICLYVTYAPIAIAVSVC